MGIEHLLSLVAPLLFVGVKVKEIVELHHMFTFWKFYNLFKCFSSTVVLQLTYLL